MIPSFTLREVSALGGEFSWRLKGAEIRYRGSGSYAQLVERRIPASDDQIAKFVEAVDLLDVWSWRKDYNPADIGVEVLDGSAWTFSASFNGRECKCGGGNGYPAFRNSRLTTTDRGRYAMLLAALYACFDIDTYIRTTAYQTRRETQDDE